MTLGENLYTGSKSTAIDPEALPSLLRWQEADMRRQLLESQIKLAPQELAVLQRRVDEEKAGLEERRKAFQELEVQRKDLDNRLKSAESQVLKYKTQQAEVRKNEEYQALTHQIELAEGEVDGLETQELEQLMKIDEAKESLRAAESDFQRRMAELAGEVALVQRRETQLRADLAAQSGAVEAAMAAVPDVWRRAYENTKSRVKRPPYVVVLDEHRCGGCHLRVSNGVAEGARQGGKPVHCDNCGRVVYWTA